MAYIGNNTSIQQYAPTITYFNGNGSTTVFTLPIAVASAAQVIVHVENVPQNPATAFTISGTTLTFTSAPPTGTNNIWVEYTSLQSNSIAPSQGTVQNSSFGSITSIPFVNGGPLGGGNASIMKNRIINGAMVIDQRNAGASITPVNGQYLTDRWYFGASQASKFTAQQNQGSVTPPVGFSYYQGLTSSSAYSSAAGDLFFVDQRIEGFNTADLAWGTANAKTVTLSFQVYSSLTGTFSGVINNSAFSYSYPFSFSVPVANTWTSISVTIAGPTAGTWVGATNGIGMIVRFNLGSGSNYLGTAGAWSASGLVGTTGSVSVVGTSGATFYITGVQLEVGTSATGFEYRQYQQELALCQRYYTKFINNNTAASFNCNFAVGVVESSTNGRMYAALPVSMRSAPTISQANCRIYDGSAAPSVTSISSNQSTNTAIGGAFNATGGGLTNGRCVILVNAAGSTGTEYLDASAEL